VSTIAPSAAAWRTAGSRAGSGRQSGDRRRRTPGNRPHRRLRSRGGGAALEQAVESLRQGAEALEQTVGGIAEAQARTEERLATIERVLLISRPKPEVREPAAKSAPAGWTTPKRAFGMPWPGVVTLEVQDDEADAFGPAAKLVDEWRGLRNGGTQAGSGVARARAQERRWELEVVMIGDFGLTLPPEKEPLDDERQHDHLRWRTKALARTRRIRARRERRRTLRRFLTLGLWWD